MLSRYSAVPDVNPLLHSPPFGWRHQTVKFEPFKFFILTYLKLNIYPRRTRNRFYKTKPAPRTPLKNTSKNLKNAVKKLT